VIGEHCRVYFVSLENAVAADVGTSRKR